MVSVHSAATRDMPAALLAEIRSLLNAAFDGSFSNDDWRHSLGGAHVWATLSGRVISHGALVTRSIRAGAHDLQVGYVEAVATDASYRGRGAGTGVMRRIGSAIEERYPLGALSTGAHHFYERLGWERWCGESFVMTSNGPERTPDDDDSLMILRTSESPHLDLDGPIICEWRTGDVW